VQWDTKIWYDNSCRNCEQDSPEFRKVIRVEKEEILYGKCGDNNALQLFSKFTEKLEDMPGVDRIVTLTKFELENLKITDE
jgi:predicted DCC family thiol-disulfide oxidoreductase YuxK